MTTTPTLFPLRLKRVTPPKLRRGVFVFSFGEPLFRLEITTSPSLGLGKVDFAEFTEQKTEGFDKQTTPSLFPLRLKRATPPKLRRGVFVFSFREPLFRLEITTSPSLG
jgi:hypothetical protein